MTKERNPDFSICEIFMEWFAENKHRLFCFMLTKNNGMWKDLWP
jgi:hypothetical protein